ncbi:MAG: hypothetical protein OD814_000322 [Candidatus Alkanophagales archaeon MCA70_species_1]|nr:hypothetical protein [Candidatus Alkanophaga volatiphilum]
MDIWKTDNKLAKYWARIPVHGVRGGIKVALAHQPFNFEEWEICGSKLVRKNSEFFCMPRSKRRLNSGKNILPS